MNLILTTVRVLSKQELYSLHFTERKYMPISVYSNMDDVGKRRSSYGTLERKKEETRKD